MTEKADERKEAISVDVMKVTVIMREIEMTDDDIVRDVEIDIDEELDVTNLN